MTKRALIIVDVQNDFLPGGALGVKRGDEIVPIINELQTKFSLVVATQDWHPVHHDSFASTHHRKPGTTIDLDGVQQILWPDHCVENSFGAQFAPAFDTKKINKIFYKGVDPHIDSYSAFFDNEKKRGTGLDRYLQDLGVQEVYLAGLTTEYCIRYTALDALSLGLKAFVVVDAIRPVELSPKDAIQALEEMRLAGVYFVRSEEIPSFLTEN